MLKYIKPFPEHEPKNRKVRKRIFSLWSRLQSLNHKGHELQHRRHLYALYGHPDSEGAGSGGALTAETRATFMRPPGSPLRWGWNEYDRALSHNLRFKKDDFVVASGSSPKAMETVGWFKIDLCVYLLGGIEVFSTVYTNSIILNT